MECVNCGRENLEKALICYWCGLDPATGEPPYKALAAPTVSFEGELAMPSIVLPPAIEVPPPMAVPDTRVGMADMDLTDLSVPELPSIEVAPLLDIPDLDHFTKVRRRRMRHRPVVRPAPARPQVTRPVLPGKGRLLVFVVGLGLLYLLGSALVAAVGVAAFGNVFCLMGLFALAAMLWVGLLLARTGRRVVATTGAVYEQIEVLGRALREVVPGAVKELPVNLPAQLDVLDLPVAYSELRYLASQGGERPVDLAVDLLSGAIASLVGRDDVILARRTYPVEVRGVLTRPSSGEASQPVITRRRAYAGPGELEKKIAQTLRTDRPMTIEELMRGLFGPGGPQQAQRLITLVSENPPDLEALAAPDEALAELEKYRQALQHADPELYKLLEDEIRRWLRAAAQRSVPSSLLDLSRYSSTTGRSRQAQRRSGSRRRG